MKYLITFNCCFPPRRIYYTCGIKISFWETGRRRWTHSGTSGPEQSWLGNRNKKKTMQSTSNIFSSNINKPFHVRKKYLQHFSHNYLVFEMSPQVYALAVESRPVQVAEDGSGRIFPKWRLKSEFLGDLVTQLSIFGWFFIFWGSRHLWIFTRSDGHRDVSVTFSLFSSHLLLLSMGSWRNFLLFPKILATFEQKGKN